MVDESSAKNKPAKEPTPYDPPGVPGLGPDISWGYVTLIGGAGVIGPFAMLYIHLAWPFLFVGLPVGWATHRAVVWREDRRYALFGVVACVVSSVVGWFLWQRFLLQDPITAGWYLCASTVACAVPVIWIARSSALARIARRQDQSEFMERARETLREEREGRLPPKKVSTAKLRAACTQCGEMTDAELLVKRLCPGCRGE